MAATAGKRRRGCLPLPKMAAGGGGRGLCPGSRARGWGGGAPGAEPEVPRCLLQLVVISCGGSVLRRRGSAAAGRGGRRHRLRHRGRKLRPLGGGGRGREGERGKQEKKKEKKNRGETRRRRLRAENSTRPGLPATAASPGGTQPCPLSRRCLPRSLPLRRRPEAASPTSRPAAVHDGEGSPPGAERTRSTGRTAPRNRRRTPRPG